MGNIGLSGRFERLVEGPTYGCAKQGSYTELVNTVTNELKKADFGAGVGEESLGRLSVPKRAKLVRESMEHQDQNDNIDSMYNRLFSLVATVVTIGLLLFPFLSLFFGGGVGLDIDAIVDLFAELETSLSLVVGLLIFILVCIVGIAIYRQSRANHRCVLHDALCIIEEQMQDDEI